METNYYTTGQFAKMAKVTERTIRYYDKIGLLKPTFVMENGYRQYNNNDFLKLQKILCLKQLGFSIEEIIPLLINNDHDIKKSLAIQAELVNKRITQLQSLKNALKSASSLVEKNELDWEQINKLISYTNTEFEIVEQYKNTVHLNSRITLHEKFSINKVGWFDWVFNHIQLAGVYRLLEVGCGNGKLWDRTNINLRNREIFLSDISDGMVEEIRNKLGKDFNCIQANCESIPFKNHYFDAVMANHVLFYIKDLARGLSEIKRVLTRNGTFYCTTYGENHMIEIRQLVHEFDPEIYLTEVNLYEQFGLENGSEILSQYFCQVERIDYPDKLIIYDVQPLLEYILSCHGNQNDIIGKRLNDFEKFLTNKMKEKGFIEITKDAGLFICKQ